MCYSSKHIAVCGISFTGEEIPNRAAWNNLITVLELETLSIVRQWLLNDVLYVRKSIQLAENATSLMLLTYSKRGLQVWDLSEADCYLNEVPPLKFARWKPITFANIDERYISFSVGTLYTTQIIEIYEYENTKYYFRERKMMSLDIGNAEHFTLNPHTKFLCFVDDPPSLKLLDLVTTKISTQRFPYHVEATQFFWIKDGLLLHDSYDCPTTYWVDFSTEEQRKITFSKDTSDLHNFSFGIFKEKVTSTLYISNL
jgi:hypothetical protein